MVCKLSKCKLLWISAFKKFFKTKVTEMIKRSTSHHLKRKLATYKRIKCFKTSMPDFNQACEHNCWHNALIILWDVNRKYVSNLCCGLNRACQKDMFKS